MRCDGKDIQHLLSRLQRQLPLKGKPMSSFVGVGRRGRRPLRRICKYMSNDIYSQHLQGRLRTAARYFI